MATPLMSLPEQSLDIGQYVVPWKSREEFLQIFHDIYGDDESLHIKAIKRIRTWKSRAGSKLSVAVESTGALFDSILLHKIALRKQQVREKENLLRSSYSLAVTRFVNFVTEKGQIRATATPLHLLAQQYGIPEWIVKLRHNTTHNILPSLDMLATAANWAVEFLKEEFWDCQKHQEDSNDDRKSNLDSGQLRGRIKQALNNFKPLRIKELKSEKEINITTVEVKELKKCIKQNRFRVMKCLLEDGFLVPSDQELEEFGLTKEDIMNLPSPHLPQSLQEFWHPVLVLVCDLKAIGTLVKFAMFSMTDEDCLRNHIIAGWLVFFLQSCSGSIMKSSGVGKKGTKSLVFSRSLLPSKVLLSVCLDNINKFTIPLLKYLMDKEELGEEAYQKLSDLLQFTPPTAVVDGHDSEEEEVYTVENVKEASFSHGNTSMPSPSLDSVQASVSGEEIGWKICTDMIDWSRVPLGVVPSGCDGGGEEGVGVEGMVQEHRRDNSDHDDDEDEDDDDESPSRNWKRSRRKRSLERDDNDLAVERSSPKRSTYVVNDTELF